MSRPGWFLPLIKLAYPSDFARIGWLIKRWPLARAVEKALFDGDRMLCLPRDRVIDVNLKLQGVDQIVLPSQLCDSVIDRLDYHVVMDFCVCRRSNECQRYPVQYGCLFMGEAAKGINPGWGRAVSKEAAKAHIRKCQDVGLIHLVGRSKLDTVWLGVGPGHKLLTICNCCPCCCIARGLPHFPENLASKIQRSPGVTVHVTDACSGCGTCSTAGCFADAIRVEADRATITDACRGCGRCVEACPQEAIRIDVDNVRILSDFDRQLSDVVELPDKREAARELQHTEPAG